MQEPDITVSGQESRRSDKDEYLRALGGRYDAGSDT